VYEGHLSIYSPRTRILVLCDSLGTAADAPSTLMLIQDGT
jgi:hypothetical protein